MKRFVLSFAFLFVAFWGEAQTLTYQLSNPRISFDGTNNDLLFDISAKASVTGTYFYTTNLRFNIGASISNSVAPVFTIGPLLSGTYNGNPKYTVTSCSWFGGDLRLIIDPYQTGLPVAAYNEVQTTLLVLGTIRVRLSSTTNPAGINFKSNAATYTNGVTYGTSYTISLGASDLTNLYLSRVYSGESGWTQANVLSGADWTQSVNTSVFDTTPAGPAHLTGTNNKAAALRIHLSARLMIDAGSDLTSATSGGVEINIPKGLIIGNETGMAQFLSTGAITYANGGSVEAYVKFAQDQWHYYTVPFTTTTARPFSLMYMKYYQEPTDHWKYVWNNGWYPSDTNLITRMQGYALWAASTGPYCNPGYTSVSGSLLVAPITSYSLTRTNLATYEGYNLVGNPFTSAIDLANATITWNNITPQAWFWDPASQNYLIWTNTGPTHSSIAPAQQGFFVHHVTTNTTPTTIVLPQAARVIDHTTNFLKIGNESEPDILYLEATTSTNLLKDKMSVFFRDNATSEYDEGLDGYKLWGNYEAPQLYSKLPGDLYLTVNGEPWANVVNVVPVGFYCGVSGSFTLTATNLESFGSKHVYLFDKVTNLMQDLNSNPVYTFNYSAGENDGRFELHFMQNALGTREHSQKEIKLYTCADKLYVLDQTGNNLNGIVSLVDMTGRKVFEAPVVSGTLNVYKPGISRGIYVGAVKTGKSIVTETVIY